MCRISSPLVWSIMVLLSSGSLFAQTSGSNRIGFVPRHLRHGEIPRVAARPTPITDSRTSPASATEADSSTSPNDELDTNGTDNSLGTNTTTKTVSDSIGSILNESTVSGVPMEGTIVDNAPQANNQFVSDADVLPLGSEPTYTHSDVGCDAGCVDPGCGPPHSYSPCGAMVWGRVEYIAWWINGGRPPILATTSIAGTAREDAGVLGMPGTEALFGGGSLFDSVQSNVRYTLGMWLDPMASRGIEASYLALDDDETYTASTGDFTSGILARPFYNASTTLQDSRLIAFPDLVTGSLDIMADTDFHTFQVSLTQATCWTARGQLDILVGYRYAGLEDNLTITERTTSLVAPLEGATFDLTDQFRTENTFHGGQLGLRYAPWRASCFQLEFTGKVALGNSNSRATISGNTMTNLPGASSSTVNGGLLTQTSNIGTFEVDNFAILSELNVTLRQEFSPRFAATVGYSIMSWSDVLRAGSVVDNVVNSTQISPGTLSGDARPAANLESTSFWGHGLNAGIEIAF
ncbi:MAG: BBP7 family outer membrane beta-barrel protein [Pirellulaceae bacterium]